MLYGRELKTHSGGFVLVRRPNDGLNDTEQSEQGLQLKGECWHVV